MIEGIDPKQADEVVEAAARRIVDEKGRTQPSSPGDLSDIGTARRFISDVDAGGDVASSPNVAPPSRQDSPSQVSTRAVPSESSTARETPPSTTVGPIRTFDEFELGGIDATSNRHVVQGTSDHKAIVAAFEQIRPWYLSVLRGITDGTAPAWHGSSDSLSARSTIAAVSWKRAASRRRSPRYARCAPPACAGTRTRSTPDSIASCRIACVRRPRPRTRIGPRWCAHACQVSSPATPESRSEERDRDGFEVER